MDQLPDIELQAKNTSEDQCTQEKMSSDSKREVENTRSNESTKVQSLGAIVNKQTSDSCACSSIIQYALSQC